MADSHHIIDGKVVPYSGGRKCNDTDAWRDATPLELQLQEQLEEYERTTAAQEAEIEALRAEVEMLRGKVDEAVVELLCRKARAERLADALRESHAEVLRLRDAMFRVYATAANGGDPTDAIEKMRDEMDKPWSGDKARAALEQEAGRG